MKRIEYKTNRRTFLKTTAAALGTISIVPRHVLGGPKFVAPSETVNIALVGAGGQGRTNARGLFGQNDARIIAVADPNEQSDYGRFYYGGVAGRLPVVKEIENRYSKDQPGFKCKQYVDFRELLE